MYRRALALGGCVLLALGSLIAPAKAQDVNRYYNYPYYYFPHNYAPNYEKWPDQRRPFARPPAYMAYPPYHDPCFRHELWQRHRYHRGSHFWLDQF